MKLTSQNKICLMFIYFLTPPNFFCQCYCFYVTHVCFFFFTEYLLLRVFQNMVMHNMPFLGLRVRLVGGVEKWEDGKLVRGWNSKRIEKIWFSLMCVWLEG